MCGIIGISGNLPQESDVVRARDTLAHRGPDDAGIFYDARNGISLGFRRLSIIDLTSAGHQPFFSNDGRFVIIFNGEIYNYIELKEELKTKYEFKTKTDTEVLLVAYMQWGTKCLEKLNGMFAFAIWDNEKHTLFCARDRVGEKPFYYHYISSTNTLYFASEIKALLKLGVRNDPNEKIIYEYLSRGFYHHTEGTFFEAIKELRGGHYLVYSERGILITRYWDLANLQSRDETMSRQDVEEQFKDLLADSIRLRFRSDVPVGINLSSGLDSNALLYYAQKTTGHDTEMFSMCVLDDQYNECPFIKDLLSPAQMKRWHTSTFTPEEVFASAEAMQLIQDQPYGGIPTAMYAGMNAVAKEKEVTVLLEGQGVDEILAGYKYYTVEYQKDVDAMHSRGIATEGSSVDLSQDMSKLMDKSILRTSFVDAHKKNSVEFKAPFVSHLLNAQYRDIVYTKLPRVLHFNDHVSMAYSRELRLPFLDHRIVEFCFFLPPQYKISGDRQKVLMRDVMKGLLPQAVSNKHKVTFGAVQTDWLRKYFKDYVYALLTSPSFKKKGYWDYEKLKMAVDEFYAGKGNNSFFIWQAINLEMWFRKFID